MNGAVSVGALSTLARADHIHASDTTKQTAPIGTNTSYGQASLGYIAPTGVQNCAFGYDPVLLATFLAYATQNSPYVRIYSTPIAPTATTNAATSIAITTATLNGTLDDKGSASSVATLSFEYGLTAPAYGSTVVGNPTSSGTAGQTFTGAISGLAAGTTYHFRAKAYDATAGTGYGADQTFTTTNPAPPTFVSAATNVAGTVITITFDKAMANPSGKHGEFSFKIGSAGRTFSSAALAWLTCSFADSTRARLPS